jgi:hypothetical protein
LFTREPSTGGTQVIVNAGQIAPGQAYAYPAKRPDIVDITPDPAPEHGQQTGSQSDNDDNAS